jgi:plasmid stabilization system protein ParE
MLQIHWTEAAIEELQERMAFIALRSPFAAERLLEQIVDAVVPASKHPYIFRDLLNAPVVQPILVLCAR